MSNFETKLYYTITEVSAMLGVRPSMLRFWEKEFTTIRLYKNKSGKRFYTQENIELIQLIYHLTKEKGYTLEGAKEYIKLKGQRPPKKLQAIQQLKELKSFLIDLKIHIEK
jgi:DNA-binding transcriptional MerR regulator